jgi:hypothetical protein
MATIRDFTNGKAVARKRLLFGGAILAHYLWVSRIHFLKPVAVMLIR